MKITLPLAGCDGTDRTVDAEIVDVAPHLAHVATFAIGPHPMGYTRFRLHNVESGFCVSAADANTKKRCIELARRHLSEKTPLEAESALRKALRQWNKLQRKAT